MAGLNAEEARIFRITHINNVPWILRHGLHCCKSKVQDPNFIPIGKQETIDKRRNHPVDVKPFGTLGDYVPFYFTPWSIMMYYIKTGYKGVTKRKNSEIVILVSSIPRLDELDINFVFTDAAAYFHEARHFNSVEYLDQIDWALLQSRNFKADSLNDPGKQGRYHAETLVHRHVPVEALLGIGCYDLDSKARLDAELEKRQLDLPAKTVGWYF